MAVVGSPQGDVFEHMERILTRRLARFDFGTKLCTLMLNHIILEQASKRCQEIMSAPPLARLKSAAQPFDTSSIIKLIVSKGRN